MCKCCRIPKNVATLSLPVRMHENIPRLLGEYAPKTTKRRAPQSPVCEAYPRAGPCEVVSGKSFGFEGWGFKVVKV